MNARPRWYSDFLPEIALGNSGGGVVVCPWCQAEQNRYLMDIHADACDFSCAACEREFTVKFIGDGKSIATGRRSRADAAYLDWYAAHHGQAGAA